MVALNFCDNLLNSRRTVPAACAATVQMVVFPDCLTSRRLGPVSWQVQDERTIVFHDDGARTLLPEVTLRNDVGSFGLPSSSRLRAGERGAHVVLKTNDAQNRQDRVTLHHACKGSLSPGLREAVLLPPHRFWRAFAPWPARDHTLNRSRGSCGRPREAVP
jgi:hypothetical protein